ncbi:exodeoxyribonuclease V, gamma subunit domain protein [Leptospira ryugenii]|uniref:Exodeoxyribonuclease V, gamma subunit domain protein n=1 Tax=Leptospira ryugenii TaxID=1917863 RepID=A0A2P2E4J9_9LEPT|nr:exodeoxyribonuclease V, gamma subunit domain protein [Leptospira ryugenii]
MSRKLAAYFKDYELNRPYWIQEWDSEHQIPFFQTFNIRQSFSEMESLPYAKIQKLIYQSLFVNQESIPRGQLFLHAWDEAKIAENQSVHLFCLSNLSYVYLEFLERISKAQNIDIYFYQFSSEKLLEHAEGSEFRKWSRPHVYLNQRLKSIAQSSKPLPLEDSSSPLDLNRLKKALIGIPSTELSLSDHSVRFWNAPSRYRELEIVANDILYKLSVSEKNGEGLRLTDFAILLPDISTYRSSIEWVFDGGILVERTEKDSSTLHRQKIPYSLVDLNAKDQSNVCKALQDFWPLCHPKGFKVDNLLALLQNPLFSNRDPLFGNLEEISSIFQELSISYFDPQNKYNDASAQIEEGLKRWMSHHLLAKDRLEQEFSITGLAISESELLSILIPFWRQLKETIQSINSCLRYGELSARHLEEIVRHLVQFFQVHKTSESEIDEFTAYFAELKSWEGIRLPQEEYLELFEAITTQVFSNIKVKKGSYLSAGVSISLLQPMRPIPFKHVYIIGLGEGKFPGNLDRSPLNLRNQKQEEWDLGRREIQESLLWESIFSAQTSITFSYVGRDTKEDKIFEPCSSYLSLKKAVGSPQEIEFPITNYSSSYIHDEESLKKGFISFDFTRKWISSNDFAVDLLPKFQNTSDLALPVLPAKPKAIQHTDLISFLQDPMQFTLRKKLGMYVDLENKTLPEETFYLDNLSRYRIKSLVYDSIIPILTNPSFSYTRDQLLDIITNVISVEKRNGRFPEYAFSLVERETILSDMLSERSIWLSWKERLEGYKYFTYACVGDTGLVDPGALKLPHLLLGRDQKLFGEWKHIYKKEDHLILFYTKSIYLKMEAYRSEFPYTIIRDYFGKMSEIWVGLYFFSLSGLRAEYFLLKDQSQKKPSISLEDFGLKGLEKEHFERLLHLFTSDELYFYPRSFLQDFIAHTKTKEPLSISEKTNEHWEEFAKENFFQLKKNLSDILKLYPELEEKLGLPKLEELINFYKPLCLEGTIA